MRHAANIHLPTLSRSLLVQTGSEESPRAIQTATEFVKTAYRGAKDNLETAEQITARVGFQATPRDTQKLTRTTDNLKWPSQADISPGFIAGMITGLDNGLGKRPPRLRSDP
jgi:hypothetical protein